MALINRPAIRYLALIALLVVLINSLALAAWAVNPSDPVNLPAGTEPEKAELPSMAGLFFKIVLCLAVIVALTYGLMRLLKRQFRTSDSSLINVIDQISLGPNRGVYLANIAGRIVALGITDHQIVKILEIDDPAVIEQLKREASAQNEPRGSSNTQQMPKTVDRFHYLIQDNLSRIRLLMEEKNRD
ncbi:MAG: FliO/MopB family protein [Firmicutes bacterium]|nr:FliO/MopB family protein [Bacillota bacterium]